MTIVEELSNHTLNDNNSTNPNPGKELNEKQPHRVKKQKRNNNQISNTDFSKNEDSKPVGMQNLLLWTRSYFEDSHNEISFVKREHSLKFEGTFQEPEWSKQTTKQTLNLTTLRFQDIELEKFYDIDYFARYFERVRFGLGFCIIVWTLFVVADVVQYDKGLRRNFVATTTLRFAVFAISFGAIVLSFTKPVSKRLNAQRLRIIIMIYILVFGASQVSFGIIEDNTSDPTYCDMIVLIASMTAPFFRLPFFLSMVCNVGLWIIFTIYSAAFQSYSDLNDFIDAFVWIFVGIAIFSLDGWRVEYGLRKSYLAARQLEAAEILNHQALLRMLPEMVIPELRKGRFLHEKREEVSVLFSHIHDFDKHTAHLLPLQVVELLNELFSAFDALTDLYGVYKIETIGDVYLVSAGVPKTLSDHANVLCVLAMAMMDVAQAKEIQQYVRLPNRIQLRIGIHSGGLIAGVVGMKYPRYRLMGDTVNTASRMSTTSFPGDIQISKETFSRLSSQFVCEYRGEIPVKGKGLMPTYLVKQLIVNEGKLDFDNAIELKSLSFCSDHDLNLLLNLSTTISSTATSPRSSRSSNNCITDEHKVYEFREESALFTSLSFNIKQEFHEVPMDHEYYSNWIEDSPGGSTRAIKHLHRTSLVGIHYSFRQSQLLKLMINCKFNSSLPHFLNYRLPEKIPFLPSSPFVFNRFVRQQSNGTPVGSYNTTSDASSDEMVSTHSQPVGEARFVDAVTEQNVPLGESTTSESPNQENSNDSTPEHNLANQLPKLTLPSDNGDPQVAITIVDSPSTDEEGNEIDNEDIGRNSIVESTNMLDLTPDVLEQWELFENTRNPFLMSFTLNKDLEVDFRQLWVRKLLKVTRRSLLGFTVALVALAIHDTIMFKPDPNNGTNRDEIELSVASGLRVVAIVSAFFAWVCSFKLEFFFIKHHQWIISTIWTILGVLQIQITSEVDQLMSVYGVTTTLLMLTSTSYLLGLRFHYVCLVSSLIWISYITSSLGRDHRFPLVALFLLAAAIISIISAYGNEYYTRIDYLAYIKLRNEQRQTDHLLKTMLPAKIMKAIDWKLDSSHHLIAHNIQSAAILFCDIVGFTATSSKLPSEEVVNILNIMFSTFDTLTTKHHVYKVETIGDAYLACSGVLNRSRNYASNLVRCALDFQIAAGHVAQVDPPANSGIKGKIPLKVRIGIHLGDVIAGVVGKKMPRYHLFGESVTIAEEIEQNGVEGRVVISENLYDRVKDHFVCTELEPLALYEHKRIKDSSRSKVVQADMGILHRWLVESYIGEEDAVTPIVRNDPIFSMDEKGKVTVNRIENILMKVQEQLPAIPEDTTETFPTIKSSAAAHDDPHGTIHFSSKYARSPTYSIIELEMKPIPKKPLRIETALHGSVKLVESIRSPSRAGGSSRFKFDPPPSASPISPNAPSLT